MNLLPAYFAGLSYLGLFGVIFLTGAGLPLPEDVALLGAGYLVHSGTTALYPTLAVALVAVLAGDLFLYAAGHRLGRALATHPRYGLSPERLARAERFFTRWGTLAIVIARFTVGVRAGVYLAAGVLRIPLPRFLLVDALAALVNVPLLVILGTLFATQLDRIAAHVAHARWCALAAVAMVLAIALLVRLRRRRNTMGR